MKKHTHNGHCEACSGPRYFKTETKEQIAARNEEMHRSYLKAQAANEAHEQAAFRRVEESEKRKQAAKVEVFLIIGVFFDGTGNNAGNTAAGILCGAHHAIKPEDLDASCKPYMSDPDSSYGNDFTNVAKLSDLYFTPKQLQPGEQGKIAYRKIYVDGIGTVAGEKDNFIGAGTGRGETGIAERVKKVFGEISRLVKDIHKDNSNNQVTRVLFDVFGFSRGAAAARHFATEVARGQLGPLKEVLSGNKTAFDRYFIGDYGHGFKIGFIGLFDTVAATAGFSNRLNVSSAITPGLNLVLPTSIARDVVQLVARDECRANFALNKVGPEHLEIVVPGVHSDVGGGYRAEAEECVLVSPMQALTVAANCDVKTTAIYQDALQAKLHMIAKGWPAEMLKIITPPPMELAPDPQDRQAPRQKRVFASLQLNRSVRGELSRVYLRVMYQLAKQKKVKFEDLDEQDSAYILPPELQPLCERFIAGDYSTTSAEEAQLKLRYIHTSAHWNNPVTQKHGWGLKVLYFNAPTENGVRVQHPHVVRWQP